MSLGGYKHRPYIKGNNDFYIIEIGGYHGEFLWLTEDILIEHKLVDTDKKYSNLSVFPYDYVEKKLLTVDVKYKSKVKGNWTCNIDYWVSTEKGCLGINGAPWLKIL